jgi:hypothetical protein
MNQFLKENVMRSLRNAAAVFAVCALALPSAQSNAQQNPAATAKAHQRVDIFAKAKPGQWVSIKGPYQKDNTILASTVKFVSGDIAEDDWEVAGKILSLDPQARTLKLVRQWPVKFQADAEFKDINGRIMAFTNLKVGTMVEIEGVYQKEAGFLGKELEEDEVKKEEEADYVSVFGKIEKADAAARTIQALGITFVINDQTKSKAAIK